MSAIGEDLQRQIAVIHGKEEDRMCMEFCNVAQQTNGSDCGLFALDFATSLCYGEEPIGSDFEATHLREFLMVQILL